MSRPSRGASRSSDVPNAGPVCPSAASLTIDVLGPHDWQLTVTWAPNINFLEADFYYFIGSDPPTQFDAFANVTSPTVEHVDPFSLATSGDTITFSVSLTGADTCPDIDSNQVVMIVP